MLRWLESFHTYKPDHTYYPEVDQFNHEELRLTGTQGEPLDVRYKSLDTKSLLIFSHGNRANISGLDRRYRFFESLPTSYLSYDYPGYGRSGGVPTEQGLYGSLDMVLRHATEELGYALEDITLHGLSLGGAVSIEAASRWPVGGLVVEASFTHSHDMGKKILRGMPLYRLLQKRFDSLGRIPRVTAPVFIIHGVNDTVVPYQHGVALYNATKSPRYFLTIPGGTHNDLLAEAPELMRRTIAEFLVSREVTDFVKPTL